MERYNAQLTFPNTLPSASVPKEQRYLTCIYFCKGSFPTFGNCLQTTTSQLSPAERCRGKGGGLGSPCPKPLAFLPGHLIAAVRSPCFQWRLLQPLGGALPRHCPPRRWRRRLPPRAGAGRAAPPYWLLSCLKAAAAVAAGGVSGGEQQRHYRRRAAAAAGATAWGAGQA